jgi:hypothetical protein
MQLLLTLGDQRVQLAYFKLPTLFSTRSLLYSRLEYSPDPDNQTERLRTFDTYRIRHRPNLPHNTY